MSYLRLDEEHESDFLEITASNLQQMPVTILVVDDHALVRAAIGHALTPQPEVKIVVMAQDYRGRGICKQATSRYHMFRYADCAQR